MVRVFLLLAFLFQYAVAQDFDFNSRGMEEPNNILKNFIKNEYDIEDVDVIGYFWDNKVLGIVKHNVFYTLEGYKLVVLEKNGDTYI